MCHPQVLEANCLISDMTAYQMTKLSSLESLNLSDNHMTHLAWGRLLGSPFLLGINLSNSYILEICWLVRAVGAHLSQEFSSLHLHLQPPNLWQLHLSPSGLQLSIAEGIPVSGIRPQS